LILLRHRPTIAGGVYIILYAPEKTADDDFNAIIILRSSCAVHCSQQLTDFREKGFRESPDCRPIIRENAVRGPLRRLERRRPYMIILLYYNTRTLGILCDFDWCSPPAPSLLCSIPNYEYYIIVIITFSSIPEFQTGLNQFN